jgi:hypothetical protein
MADDDDDDDDDGDDGGVRRRRGCVRRLLKVHSHVTLLAAKEKQKKSLRSDSCVGTHHLNMFANAQGRWGQSVL